MSYRRVTWEDRIKIKLLLQQGKNKSEIAEIIGKDKSTVGREIKRNTGGRGYRPKQAQKFAEEREASKHRPYKMTERTCAEIKKRLKKKWSPEQISNVNRRPGRLL